MGFSMRVENSTVDDVKSRLAGHAASGARKRRLEAEEATRPSALEEHDRRIEEAKADERERKRARKEAEREERQKAHAESTGIVDDAEAMAMMGFGGFGGSKKKR